LKRDFPNARLMIKRGEGVDFSEFPSPVVVVSNLPYYASVQIFKHLTENKSKISRMVLMFQKEVALRVSAGPGGRHYGSLSVWSSYNWEIGRVVSVPPSALSPPPKVESEVLSFTPRLAPPVGGDEKNLFRLVRASFTQKRRTLVNNLKNIYSAESIKSAMNTAGLGPKARAEEISLVQFGAMAPLLVELEKES
jgi:16S rRNA (adenine1518-N6/adenine1519-N6)-dimethyltransferase